MGASLDSRDICEFSLWCGSTLLGGMSISLINSLKSVRLGFSCYIPIFLVQPIRKLKSHSILMIIFSLLKWVYYIYVFTIGDSLMYPKHFFYTLVKNQNNRYNSEMHLRTNPIHICFSSRP